MAISNEKTPREAMIHSEVTVDVVIPTFNSSDFLPIAIQSCLSQTYPVNQIIVVDDGSSEESRQILLKLESSISNLTVILNHHTGLPGIGRELGIKASNATWIAFLDSDDYWATNKIKRQLTSASQTDADLVYTNGWRVGRSGSLALFHDQLPKSLTLEELLPTNWLLNSSVLAKRDLFSNGFSYATSGRVRAVEDYATWLRLAAEFEFIGIDEPLTYYRESDDSIRFGDDLDPRIHAIADFIVWAQSRENKRGEDRQSEIRAALKALKKQYVT